MPDDPSLLTRALAEPEQLLDAVLATMPAGVVVRDARGAVVRTNAAMARLLGYEEGELRKTEFWSITHPADVPGDAKSSEELLAGEPRVMTRVKRFRHAEGHYIWARLSSALLRGPGGQVRGTVAVVEDVTAEHQAEEAAVQQARLYHTIARNIPGSAVLLFDADLRFIAADGAELLASIGLDRDELEGRTVTEIARPEQRAEMEQVYREALAGNSGEYESERQGRLLKTRVAPVWNDETIAGGVALVHDVTEERAQAESVRRAKALFEVTIASVRDGVVVLDAEHRVLYANRAYAELFDFDPAVLVGTTRAEFVAHVGARVRRGP